MHAAGGAGGVTTYEALKRADAAWLDMRTQQVGRSSPRHSHQLVRDGQRLQGLQYVCCCTPHPRPPCSLPPTPPPNNPACGCCLLQMYGPRPEFVRTSDDPLPAAPEYDVAVCGGTLGIFLACALQVG